MVKTQYTIRVHTAGKVYVGDFLIVATRDEAMAKAARIRAETGCFVSCFFGL